MRVVARSALVAFWAIHADAEHALAAWYAEAKAANWTSPEDVLTRYPSADVIAGNRMVFNIKGNKYRLIVKFMYRAGIIYIRFIGTHAEYDQVDAERV